MNENIGSRLKQWRVGKGIKQKQLSEMTGIKASSLSEIETGKIVPSGKTLQKIFDRTDIDPNYLLGQNDKTAVSFIETNKNGNKLSFGQAVDLLRKIYDCDDVHLVTAIAHNLVQFSKLARPTATPESELADRIAKLEDKCDEAVKLIKEHHHPKVKRAVNDGET
jgi:transcriptional regulator with XRE-family HTH domain